MNKKSFIVLLISLLALPMMSQNPFFKKATTPYGTFPFNQLKNEHYLPAFEEGIKQHAAEVDKIANNKKQPTFANTIVALERSGALLSRVSYVFLRSIMPKQTMRCRKLRSVCRQCDRPQ